MTLSVGTTAPRHLDCEQTVRRLWDYLDGEVGSSELAAIDAHLLLCDPCNRHFTFERRFLDALRAARQEISGRDAASLRALRSRVVDSLVAAGELPNGWRARSGPDTPDGESPSGGA